MDNQNSNFTSFKIDHSRLLNQEAYKNLENLIKCKICFNVLVNPYDCDKCGNTFCHNCINSFIQVKKPCLFKCENFKIKQSSLAITSYLSSLKFNCLNKDEGCNQVLTYLQVLTHDRDCTFSFSICPNVKCNKTVKRHLLENHIRRECEYTLFKCEYCHSDIRRNDYFEHVQNCKTVTSIFDLKEPIIDVEVKSFEDLNLKDISMRNFMKMILFQMGKTNLEFSKKFDTISNEIKDIKDNFGKYTSNNSIFIENLSNEIEGLTEKVLHLDVRLANQGEYKKLSEENSKDTVIIKESVNLEKTSSKENSLFGISTGNNSINNTKSNIPLLNTNNNQNSFKKHVETPNKDLVKKITLRQMTKAGKRSPERSPVAVYNTNLNRSQLSKTYNSETENYYNRTNNITLLKNMVKNQEIILENLDKIITKVVSLEINLHGDIKQNHESIKEYLYTDVVDEIKSFHLQTSFDISERIIKKIEDAK